MNPSSPGPLEAPSRSTPLLLDADQAQAVARLVEAAPQVHRRHQFFVWSQSQMLPLLPHQLLVCGAWERQSRALRLDLFNTVPLPPPLAEALGQADSPLMRGLQRAWLAGRGRPCVLDTAQLLGPAAEAAPWLQQALGHGLLLVHASSRPQRLEELETLFVLSGPGAAEQLQRLAQRLDLLLPHLHATWLRVAANEGQPWRAPQAAEPASAASARAGPRMPPVTPRERQILRWAREGKSNLEIGQTLGISPMTVKNHVQKILRKLGAVNRAQAVAKAMALNLIELSDAEPRDPA